MTNLAILLEPLDGSSARASAAEHHIGFVTSTSGADIGVRCDQRLLRARRAASCLLEPAVGDRVACIQSGADAWIIAILHREEGHEHLLSCDGPTRLRVARGALTIGADSVRIESNALALEASTMKVSTDQALVVGREFRFVSTMLRLVGKTFTGVFDRVTHFSKHYLRTTEGVDRVQAAHVEQEAQQLLRLSGEHALINGEKLIKARGGQIHFG